MTERARRWRCKSCDGIFAAADMLSAAHPFKQGSIEGCPLCREACGDAELVCDERGCTDIVSCGWPSEDGYRNTCSEHHERCSSVPL